MVRDMEKAIKLVHDGTESAIPAAYQLSGEEVKDLMKCAETNTFEAISRAFWYGYVLGHRATEKGRYTKLERK